MYKRQLLVPGNPPLKFDYLVDLKVGNQTFLDCTFKNDNRFLTVHIVDLKVGNQNFLDCTFKNDNRFLTVHIFRKELWKISTFGFHYS
mgnify:FL=1